MYFNTNILIFFLLFLFFRSFWTQAESDISASQWRERGRSNGTGPACMPSMSLILLLVTYLLNQLDRYALAVCTQPMAQDIGYGDYGCLKRENVSRDEMGNGCPKNLTGDE